MLSGAFILMHVRTALTLYAYSHGDRNENLKRAFIVQCALAIYLGISREDVLTLKRKFEKAQLIDKEEIYLDLWFTICDKIQSNLEEMYTNANEMQLLNAIKEENVTEDLINQT